MRGLGNEHLENLRLESWNSGQNKTENSKFSKNLNGVGGGAHERHIDGKFRERRLAWKKRYDPAHPVPLSNMSAPGYLLVSTWK